LIIILKALGLELLASGTKKGSEELCGKLGDDGMR
jgi:hypothetical protein